MHDKKKKLLTNKQQELYENSKIYYVCKEKYENEYIKDIVRLEIIVVIKVHKCTDAAHSICNLKYSVPNEIT